MPGWPPLSDTVTWHCTSWPHHLVMEIPVPVTIVNWGLPGGGAQQQDFIIQNSSEFFSHCFPKYQEGRHPFNLLM